ncbi:MAG: hypothetical protein IJV43_01600 [Oscillospiraceae bacterium]|nr:hypothetical protein [Oscillospiraceae bacterium]
MADEKKYIEAEASLSLLVKNWRCTKSADDAIQKTIDEWDSIPAADVRPVVRGRWLTHADKRRKFPYCSECSRDNVNKAQPSFCPNCGADMRAEE